MINTHHHSDHHFDIPTNLQPLRAAPRADKGILHSRISAFSGVRISDVLFPVDVFFSGESRNEGTT